MPQSYYVLLGRDIFTKEPPRQVFGGDPFGGTPPPPPPPTTGPTTAPAPSYEGDPDGSLALLGIAASNGTSVAFIEDTSSGRTLMCKPGDVAGRGKISRIGFDHIDFDRNGMVMRIEVGQYLNGQAASATPLPAASSGSAAAPSGPLSSPGVASSGASNDIVERMRRRRAAENGGR